MAAAETLLGVFGTLWTVFQWTWWLLLLIILWVSKKRYERWPIDAVIVEKKGDNLVKSNDRIGRMYDKGDGLTYYQLQKIGDTIPVINFDWVLVNADKPTNIFEKIVAFLRPTVGTVFLFRYGSKQYKPIKVGDNTLDENKGTIKLTEIKGKDGKPIYSYQYKQYDPRNELGALNFEVVDWDNMNFMVQEHRTSAIRRAKKGDFWKQLAIPAMIMAVTALVALLLLKFSADAGADLRTLGAAAPPQTQEGGSVIGNAINEGLAPGG